MRVWGFAAAFQGLSETAFLHRLISYNLARFIQEEAVTGCCAYNPNPKLETPDPKPCVQSVLSSVSFFLGCGFERLIDKRKVAALYLPKEPFLKHSLLKPKLGFL